MDEPTLPSGPSPWGCVLRQEADRQRCPISPLRWPLRLTKPFSLTVLAPVPGSRSIKFLGHPSSLLLLLPSSDFHIPARTRLIAF